MRLEGVRIEENQIEWTVGAKRTGGQYGIWALGQKGHLGALELLNNRINGFADNQYPGGGIALEQVTGAQVQGNQITMPEFAGREGSCAGIRVRASSDVRLIGNDLRIPDNANAIGLQLEPGNRALTHDRNTIQRVKGSRTPRANSRTTR
jgi:hypothetical protein